MISLAAGGTPVSATTTSSWGASFTMAAIFQEFAIATFMRQHPLAGKVG